jgi:hypothetical protein
MKTMFGFIVEFTGPTQTELQGNCWGHSSVLWTWRGPRMSDQQPSNPKPALKRTDRYLFGAILFGALVIGLLLYNTRDSDQTTNQGGLISAPEMPGVPGGKK